MEQPVRKTKRKCVEPQEKPGFYKALSDIDTKDLPVKRRTAEPKWKEGQLFEVEVLQETADQVYVAYPGWKSKYNEWLPKKKVAKIDHLEEFATENSFSDRAKIFCIRLKTDIKRRLVGYRKKGPKIIITRDTELDVAESVSGLGQESKPIIVRSNSELVDTFGPRWMERATTQKELCLFTPGTVKILLHHHKPLEEIAHNGSELIHDSGYFIKFQFVRGDATEADLNSTDPKDYPWRQ